MLNITRLTTSQADFASALDHLLAFESAQDAAIERTVMDILSAVKARGDAAVQIGRASCRERVWRYV